MPNKRTNMHRLQELVRLHRMETPARTVARLLKMSPNTERRYRLALEAEGILAGKPEDLPSMEALRNAVLTHQPVPKPVDVSSSVDEWCENVTLLVDKGLGPRAIYDRLRLENSSFKTSYWAVKRFVRRLVKARGVQAQDISIIVDTNPGEVAQVDFGYVGRLLDPRQHVLRRAWVFVMVLGHSRHMFCRVVFDQKTDTWLQLHIDAFEYFGGSVQVVVPDNLKAAVLRNAFGLNEDTSLNRSYRELARHYGFKIDPTPPYSPKKKGKVESAVKYVKNNALKGRHGESVTEVNYFLSRWVEEIAGTRQHGRTLRQPLEMFRQEEANALRCLPAHRFESVLWKQARVHRDSHVECERKLYSVPWRLVGQQLWLRCTETSVVAFWDDTRVATHSRNFRGRRSTQQQHLPEHRRDLAYRSESYWRNRASMIGAKTVELIEGVLDQDPSLSHLRDAQAIVTHLEQYPASRAEAAATRALYFGVLKYRGVKSILTKALDLEPLPLATPPEGPVAAKYGRNLRKLLDAAAEVSHEPH